PHHHSPQQDDPQNTPEGDRQATPGNSPEHTPQPTDRQEEERANTVAALQAVIPHSPFHYLLAQVLDSRALQDPDTLAAAQQADAALQAGRGNTPPPQLSQRAEQILDQLTQRALTDRAQTALSTQTDPAFPTDPAQRRTTLLNAAARAADEKVIGWLPADLLWLYTEKGSQARQDLNIFVTRAGIIRNFAARKFSGAQIQPFIRGLQRRYENWVAVGDGQISMSFLRGTEGSLPYIVHGPTNGHKSQKSIQYQYPEEVLGYLANDRVLNALAPDAHLALIMWTHNGSAADDTRELAWNAADEHHRIVDFATVNSRLSNSSRARWWFGLDMANDVCWTTNQLKQRWKRVTPQQAEQAGYGPLRELLGEAVRNDPALLARVRRSLARWTGEISTEAETRALTMERLDRLAEHMLPDRVRSAFNNTFPADPERRRGLLFDAAKRAVEEGVAGWLPAGLLWLYTENGIQARHRLKVTVTQAGILRNSSPVKIPNLQPEIRALHNAKVKEQSADPGSEKADAAFLLGDDGALPYLLYGPAKVTVSDSRLPYANPGVLLARLEKDNIFQALPPDTHLVLAIWGDSSTPRQSLRELAHIAATKCHRSVNFSTVNVHITKQGGKCWLALEAPDGVHWTEQEIRDRWSVEHPPGYVQPEPRLLTGPVQGPASSADGSRMDPASIPARYGADSGDNLTTDDAMDIDFAEEERESGNVDAPPGREGAEAGPEAALPGVSLDYLLAQVVDESALSDDPVTMEAARQVNAALQARRRNLPEPALDGLALQILDQLTQRALPERVRTALSTKTEQAFSSESAQSRTALLDAMARAANEGVIDWLPADLLWLYTEKGTQARQDLNVSVTRAGIIRNFTAAKISGPEVRPAIRNLNVKGTHWFASVRGPQIGTDLFLGKEKSLPYVLYGSTKSTKSNRLFTYKDPEALLGHLKNDRVLQALAPDAHLVLMMWSTYDDAMNSVRYLAWDMAAEHDRIVDFSTVNSRLSAEHPGGRWFGLETADSVPWTAPELQQRWRRVTPQQAERAGYGRVREMLGQALRNDPTLLARVRGSLARWNGETAVETDTRALTMERLERLAERMLPERVQDAFGGVFPADTDRRRQVLLEAALRAAEEGVSGWLPVGLLWLYTEPGAQARQDLNITISRAGIVRNFSGMSVHNMHSGIRAVHNVSGHWVPTHGSETADSAFLFGTDGSLPYLLYGPTQATGKDYPFRYGNGKELLELLEEDRVLRALAPDAHLVPAIWEDTGASDYGVREVAWNAAAVHGRVVDFSTANSRLSKEVKGARSLGLEVADGEAWSKERILQHWKVVTAEDAERAGDGLVPALLGVAAGEDDGALAGVRRALVRWAGVAADEGDTDGRVGERLDRLAERMLPEHVRKAFGDVFPADAGGRREVLRSAVVRAAEEGVAGWLPASLLWLYTDEGTRARRELNVTVTRAGVVRDFSSAGDVRELRPFIRGLHEDGEGNWLADEDSASISSGFWAARDGSLPYLLLGPARATDDGHPIPDTDSQEFLQQLEDDRVLKAMAPDAHLVLAVGNSSEAFTNGLGELAMGAAAAHGRVVDYSTATVSVSARSPHGQQWLGLRLPPATHMTAQDIRQQWTSVNPLQASQQVSQRHGAAASAPRRLRRRNALMHGSLGEAVLKPGALPYGRQVVGVLQELWRREQRGQAAGEPFSLGGFDELTARILGIDAESIWETDRLRLVKLVTEAAAENRADSIDQLTAYALRLTVSTASSRILPRPLRRTTAPTNTTHTASAAPDGGASAPAGTSDDGGIAGENGDGMGAVAGVRDGDVADGVEGAGGDVVFVGARPAAGDVRGGDVWRGGARFWLSRSTLKRVGRLDLS
ncbi:hypothetical protein ACIP10_37065, partial [Streptomyces galbus]|uniref:hypothetical protein n=1 Tax=Streptomyces galbus TaxID=33898 RepID=UPI003829C016